MSIHSLLFYFFNALFFCFAVISNSFIVVVHANDELHVMRALKDAYKDWKPRGVVDVGANIGTWTQEVQKIYPDVKTFMLEASPEHTKELEETKNMYGPGVVDFQISVLTSRDGDTVDFYALKDSRGTGNSIFAEQTSFYKGTKPDKRTTAKLDTLVKDMEYIDYLKLDVQGAELIILSGATETLKRTTFVQLEVSVIEYNKGGACWHEIDEFLRQNGFHFYDLGDSIHHEFLFRTKGVGQFDVLYIKPTSDFMPKWLVKKDVKFCGSSTEITTKEEATNIRVSSLKANSTTEETKSTGFDHKILLSITFLAFLAGFLVGRTRGKHTSKTD